LRLQFHGILRDFLRKWRSRSSIYDIGIYVALLEELEAGTLEEALRVFISVSGLPSHVGYGSDLDACHQVLAEQGKITKWYFMGNHWGRMVTKLERPERWEKLLSTDY
jgi:hypothetical protein